jgi:hypothetical protein
LSFTSLNRLIRDGNSSVPLSGCFKHLGRISVGLRLLAETEIGWMEILALKNQARVWPESRLSPQTARRFNFGGTDTQFRAAADRQGDCISQTETSLG